MTTIRSLRRIGAPALAALALLAGAAHAQNTNSTYTNTWMPWSTGGGYVGLNLGRSDYSVGCGTALFGCDTKDNFARLSLGAMVGPHFGYELGYFDAGDANRAGGETSARGLNFSLVGRVPLAQSFSLYGKLGTTYGRTRVSSAIGSGIPGGAETGWGLAYALGASWDFSNQWSAVLEWERHDMKFAGEGRQDVDAASVGLRYRF